MDHNTSGTNWGNVEEKLELLSQMIDTLKSLSGGSNGSTITDGQIKTFTKNLQIVKLLMSV